MPSPVKKQRADLQIEPAESLLRVGRGLRVILDADLAQVYGVSTKQLNQAVKRFGEKFSSDFAFQLKPQEVASLRSHIATSNSRGGRRYHQQPEPKRREIGFHVRDGLRTSSLTKAR